MAHFAKLGTNSKVIAVHVLNNSDMLNADNQEDESVGQQRLAQIHGWPAELWIQTSYNTKGGKHYDANGDLSSDQSKAFRGNYAGIGSTYDAENDVFYPPAPFASWALDSNWTWQPPIDYPGGPESYGNAYIWDEDVYQADRSDPKTEGWVSA